jgi:pilus assembly protein CpaF
VSGDALLGLVLEHPELAELDPGARRLALRALVADLHDGAGDVGRRVSEVVDVIDGYGRLTPLMTDECVTDVLVNGPHEVWIERDGNLECTDVAFADVDELDALVQRLVAEAGARADLSHPIASGRLRDGARLHVVLPPVAPGGPLISIRRFSLRAPTLRDLVAAGMMTRAQGQRLSAHVDHRRTIAISGATGTGKTTLLNALLGGVPASERVVTVEETPELSAPGAHVAALVAREENTEGRGRVDLTALVRAALRMRPDRIVIGEVRGAEALAALGAMSTGHEGSMLTLHARSPADALQRLVTLALEASSGASERALDAQVRRALDVVVQLASAGGRRRLTAIEEID